MEKFNVEISNEYRETLDFLKQILWNKDWQPIESDSELIETMIGWFMMMINGQMAMEEKHTDWCGCGHHH